MIETVGTQILGFPLGKKDENSDDDDDEEPVAPVRKAKAPAQPPRVLPRRASSRVQGKAPEPEPGPLATAGANKAPNGGESAAACEARASGADVRSTRTRRPPLIMKMMLQMNPLPPPETWRCWRWARGGDG